MEDSKQLDWQQLIEQALVMPGSVSQAYSRFYNYSFLNQVLLMSQGVLEPVATYKRWQEAGRQVLKGAKAKAIVRPVIIERKDENGEVEQRHMHFKAVRCIFGLSDTEGPDLPEVDIPAWNINRALETLDIREVPFEHLNGNVQGLSWDHNLAVNPVAAHPFKTTIHETAHIVSGHTVADKHAEYATHRGLFEFEAEGTAHLVCNELEVLTPEQASSSRAYLQGWLQGERPPDSSVRRVFSTTDTILKAGRLAAQPSA